MMYLSLYPLRHWLRSVSSAPQALLCLFLLTFAPVSPLSATERQNECFGEDMGRRIEACSAIIDGKTAKDGDLALAYSARALAYAVAGKYDRAIPDYDASLKLDPDSAVALNNRAWAYVRSGLPEHGTEDVEKALALAPDSPQTLDTRAHIFQARGDTARALRDYEDAIRFGGTEIVRLYQCGLQSHALFAGDIDGLYTSEMRKALETCVATSGCDPLPADEECRKITS